MKIKKKHIIITFFLFLLILAASLALFRRQSLSRPDVLLITIDALRSDHLGCYGYQRGTSPNIDRLAKKGVVFRNCFSTGCGTAYSFPALLTGRYLEVGKDYVFLDNILDRKFTSLARYLKNAGYYTAAFINNGHLKTGKGFEQGFDYFINKWDAKGDAEEITRNTLNFIKYYRDKKPLFIWVHYFNPHVPYSSPEEYFKVFENDKLYKDNDRILELGPASVSNPYTSRGYIPKIVFRQDEYHLNYYIARYDAAILYTDFYLGKLLENLSDNTVIILTADHGEFLGEHNYYFVHEENIYDAVLHTPLIIKDNRDFNAGKSISAIVSSVDIVPTILNRINPVWYFFNKNRFDGKDLKTILHDKDISRKYIYSYFPWSKSIRDVRRNIKYILDSEGKEALYFLPDEDHNYINDNSARVLSIRGELKKNLEEWFKRYPVRSDLNSQRMFLDRNAEKLLKSLGYLH